jgi:hypothetical protein
VNKKITSRDRWAGGVVTRSFCGGMLLRDESTTTREAEKEHWSLLRFGSRSQHLVPPPTLSQSSKSLHGAAQHVDLFLFRPFPPPSRPNLTIRSSPPPFLLIRFAWRFCFWHRFGDDLTPSASFLSSKTNSGSGEYCFVGRCIF